MGQWLCDAASIYNRWALQQRWKSPGIPAKKQNTELSASILHPGTVFIWITPPNPLSNDMTQWVTFPQILLREKHWVFGREQLERSEKTKRGWVSKEFQRNRILEWLQRITLHIYRECMCDSERIDTRTNCQGVSPQSSCYRGIIWKKFADYYKNFAEEQEICHLMSWMLRAQRTPTASGWNLPWIHQRGCNCSPWSSWGPWTSRCVGGREGGRVWWEKQI